MHVSNTILNLRTPLLNSISENYTAKIKQNKSKRGTIRPSAQQ